jgi:eukaryotic-like serine/threonine-protein kinase
MVLDNLQNGRYHHLRLLGSGGMGEVYLMEDTRVSRQVAIKVIRTEGEPYPDKKTDSDPATRLFQREAKAIAALEHPNILPLYDFGEEVRDNATITYMVMPYSADGSLEGWLRQRPDRVLSPQNVAYLVEQAAEALQYAHEHEVIHLDVKPSNFLVRSNKKNWDHPTLLLADFGIARNFTTVSSSSHTIRGTPTAMAPEQWTSTPVFATDQYALAVMAYELLVGRPPFVGRMEQLMYQHFNTQPLAPSDYNPRLSAALDAVILRALAKKPEERFSSVTDFASALTQAAQESPTAPATGQEVSNEDTIAIAATLAISQADAISGVSRLITLPGGRQMVVPIPAGVQEGQIIRLANPDNSSSQADGVILTIAIRDTGISHTPIERVSGGQVLETPRSGISAPSDAGIDHNLPTVASFNSNAQSLTTIGSFDSNEQSFAKQVPAVKKTSRMRLGGIATLSIVVVILLLAGTIFFYVNHQSANQPNNSNAINHTQTPTVVAKLTPSLTATTRVQNGLYIAGTYNGSMFDETISQSTLISISLVQTKGDATLSGTFTFKSPTQGVYMLNGTDDTQGNFSFTVQQPAGQTPLYFFGTFQQAAFLHGNFCSSGTGSCPSSTGTGYFTVGPRL